MIINQTKIKLIIRDNNNNIVCGCGTFQKGQLKTIETKETNKKSIFSLLGINSI